MQAARPQALPPFKFQQDHSQGQRVPALERLRLSWDQSLPVEEGAVEGPDFLADKEFRPAGRYAGMTPGNGTVGVERGEINFRPGARDGIVAADEANLPFNREHLLSFPQNQCSHAIWRKLEGSVAGRCRGWRSRSVASQGHQWTLLSWFRCHPFTTGLGGVRFPLIFLQPGGKLAEHADGDLDIAPNHPVENGARDLDNFRVLGGAGA